MAWVRDGTITWIQRIAINVIKCGRIPTHIAFIMDGNRRFATKTNMPSRTDGHAKGFDKLSEALDWCLQLGIKEVTVYAFSIENFKRSAEEVDTLMVMAREKFGRLMEEKDKLNERGICIRIVGNLALLPLDLQQVMAEAMLLTEHNTNAILNVAFAYTSRDEITESMRTCVRACERGELRPDHVDDTLMRRCMYTRRSPDPDLLVRTSGEARLSDFLLWQVSTIDKKVTFSLLNSIVIVSLRFPQQLSTSRKRYGQNLPFGSCCAAYFTIKKIINLWRRLVHV